MRRSLTFTAAWVVAAGVATTAAWQGVGLVTNQVTDDRPPALAAADVRDKLDDSSSTTTTAPPGSTTTSTSTVEPTVTRTYDIDGGSTALHFAPSGVTVLWSTPKPGFDVDIEPEHGNGYRVEFESDSHRSRVEGWWDGGPQDRTREDH